MANTEENLALWQAYNWPEGGDEWSREWGTVHMQWWGSIFPRIVRFLPVHTILEIAPGYGRWTQFLVELCNKLIAVDLCPKSIEACKKRFHDNSKTEFYCNDGKSLEMVPDNSIDFVFSFDSLVHVSPDIIECYLAQLADKLTHNGIVFFHHSNLGNHKWRHFLCEYFPITAKLLTKLHLLACNDNYWRCPEMTAEKFATLVSKYGFVCLSQECINWNMTSQIDCFSIFTKNDSRFAASFGQKPIYKNDMFFRMTKYWKNLSKLYG